MEPRRRGAGASPIGPVRTCIGCRRRLPAALLVRVVRLGDGRLAVGRALPGRGAWLCRSPACVAQAVARRAFDRALRAPVSGGAAEVLQAELAGGADVGGWIPAP